MAGDRRFQPTPGYDRDIDEPRIGTIWQIFENSEYGIGRFEVSAPSALPQQQRFGLTFRLLQWRWQLETDISFARDYSEPACGRKKYQKMKICMTTF